MLLAVFALALAAFADDPPPPKPAPLVLTLEGDIDAELAPVAGQLARLFYEGYPKLLKRFEHPMKPAPRNVRVVFVKGLRVPAQAGGGKVEVSVDWLRKHPDDVALLTHELTHLVQQYPRGGPGWLTEGIADYARREYGPKDQPNWSLPKKLTAKQSYKDAYRTTARFLVWLEARTPGAVDKLHRAMQDGAYKAELFETIAGRTADALWDECVAELSK